jgi:hypothetical protein
MEAEQSLGRKDFVGASNNMVVLIYIAVLWRQAVLSMPHVYVVLFAPVAFQDTRMGVK